MSEFDNFVTVTVSSKKEYLVPKSALKRKKDKGGKDIKASDGNYLHIIPSLSELDDLQEKSKAQLISNVHNQIRIKKFKKDKKNKKK